MSEMQVACVDTGTAAVIIDLQAQIAELEQKVAGITWKSGDEFLPYHPQASHVPPQYRDGWNACFASAADWLQKALEERANEIKANAAALLSFPGMEHETRCRELVALELESLGRMIQLEQIFAKKLAVLSKRRQQQAREKG